MQRLVDLEVMVKKGSTEDVLPICDGISKFIQFDLTVNKNALDGFSKLFLRVLDRLFGEYVTGYIAIIDEKHWTKGDHGGWIRLVNSNTRSTLAPANTNNTNTNSNATNKVPGASSVKSSVSGFSSSFLSAASEVTGSTDRITSSSLAADEYIIRLLSPHSNVMEIFLYQYKQREYAMRVEIFPQKIKALLSGNTLLRCYSSPVIRTLGTHLQSRCTNQTMTSVGAGTSAGTGIKKAVSLMLDPYEYFTVCLVRYPTIVPFTKQQTATRSTYGGYNNYASYGYNYSSPSTTRVASDAVGSFTRAMGAGEVIGITEEWIRGNNYLKLFLQYVQHNIPLMEYNPSSNEFSNNDIACASGQVETNTNHGHGHLKSRHTPSKHSRSGAGLNSSGGVMSNKALIIQANRDFFFNMLCVYLIETAIVVRHSFAVAANAVAGLSSSANSSLSAPLVDSFTINRQTGSVSHPHPLNVIVLNMNALDTHKAASSVGSLDARTGELGWCPTVEALQCIYVLLVHLHYGSMLRDTTVQTNPDTSRSFDSDVIRISNSNSGSRRTNGIAELYTLVHNENVTMLLNHCCGKVTHPHPNSMDADDGVCNYNVEGDVELLRFIYSMWQPDFGMSNSTNTNSHTFDSNTFIEAISYGASMPISDLSASHASRMVTGSPVSSPISRGGIGFESNHLHSTNRAKGGPTGAVGWCGSEVQQKLQQPLYDMLRSLFFNADKVSHEVLVFAIELWLAYLQPWKCEGLNSSYSAKWKSYVIANFHFYSTLFCILIQSLCDKMATSYSIQDGNSLRLVNYLDVILNQLYGGKGSESGAPCALKILIDQCGSELKNVLKCSLTAGSGRMGGSPTRGSRGSFIGSPTPNSYSSGRNTAESVYTLSRSDIFVLACQHRLLYPDPSVLSDLEDCGIIPCIVTCCQPFITKFYEVLATLQCGYESNAASTSDDSRVNAEKQQGGAAKEAFKGRDGILGHVEWAENCLRTFLGFHSLTPSKLSATAIPSNKNTQRIEAIAKHIAAVFPTNPLTDFVALCDTMRITSASSRLHSIAGDGTLDTLQKEFSRRKRILDMHLPCTYFNDLDRDRVGKVTEVGLKQLVSGKRKCMKTLIKSHVDVLDLPVTSREVEIVALLMIRLSKYLNDVQNLPANPNMNTVSWEDIYYDLCYREEEESDINQLKTKINNVAYTSTKSIVSRVSIWYENITKRIPNGIRQGFRWNFRWVANVRVSIFIGTILLLIAAFCLLYGMSYGLQWCCLGEDFSLVAKNRMQSALASSVALVVGVYWYCGIGKVLYNGNFSGIYRF